MRLPSLPQNGLIPSRDQIFENAYDNAKRALLATRTLVTRQSQTSDDSSTTSCVDTQDKNTCGKYVSGSAQTLPIVLGAVIPIVFCFVVLIFLHRRLRKKEAIEDLHDPHKSLDFGMGPPSALGARRGKNLPEMTITDMGADGHFKSRGLSMDMGLGSPYLLPGAVHDSRESLHSMSRSIQDEHDPYRPSIFVRGSSDSNRPKLGDNGSVYSASTGMHSQAENARLLMNAQRFSKTYPARTESVPAESVTSPDEFPLRQVSRKELPPLVRLESSATESTSSPSTVSPPNFSLHRKSLPTVPMDSSEEDIPSLPQQTATQYPPRTVSVAAPAINFSRESSNYGDDPFEPLPEIPIVNEPYEFDDHLEAYTGRFSIDTPNPSIQFFPPEQPENNRLSVMGMRPLPPTNVLTEENAEQRANRIRSFYKEYFDDSKQGGYEQDWDAGGQPNRPFAQPIGRRAMTPPPGGAPRFGGDSHARHQSTMSGGRRGNHLAPPKAKKKLPPAKPLLSLPTPHKLGYDSSIASPIDFAPAGSVRDLAGSRPSTPGVRSYTPNGLAFTPLVSSFDDLQVMPSPHHLRKSGTFTSLDFAPPRFKTQGDYSGSDNGSIRSARSGISAMQMDAVRAGAYRVSRIPKEMVTTKEDIMSQLRPKMDLVSRA